MAQANAYLLTVLAALGGGTAAVAAEGPRIDHVGPVAPDILGITIMAGRVEYGRQVPYAKQANDAVVEIGVQRFVLRQGKVIGTLVGKAGDLLCTMDQLVGQRLDTAWADRPASYTLQSAGDPRYLTPQNAQAVYRKSKPSDLAMTGAYQFAAPTENVVYLKLPAPLAAGSQYVVSFRQGRLPDYPFRYDPTRLRSEAVHVGQLGFRPDDPAKAAFLSCWMGSGGGVKYAAALRFTVLDDSTGGEVFSGLARLSKAADDRTEDAYRKNYNGADVYLLDFTPLARPGKYRVCADGIGCSYPFEIAEDAWTRAFVVSARGFYHQRSGIALGPPFTAFRRRRPFHPDDGLVVYASKTPLVDTGNGLNEKDSNFGNLVKGKTGEIVENAWGGYMDAGDWDRRVQHLKSTRLLLELAELFPDFFSRVSLNIPESGDGLPDVVNEALFNLDFYRRLQRADGGVRGGIESSEHPRRGEASFQESLTVMAYAPDIFSSHVYAGTAARAARWLASRDPRRAAAYRQSALAAAVWAENDRLREERQYLMARHPAVRDARNYAAAELFRLTGDARWHDLFLATTLFQAPVATVTAHWDSLDQTDSAWVYARTDRPGMDQRVKENCRKALLREAEDRAASVDRTGFRWAKHPYGPVVFGAASSPDACVNLVRAHVLSHNPRHLRALVLACQAGAGANPVNICYTTGLGSKCPQHPLQIDYRVTHQAPPSGLTVGGPMDNSLEGLKDPFIGAFAGSVLFPPLKQWPALEAFWDVFWDPIVCEYTIQKPMAANAYVWGYLAAREKGPAAVAPAQSHNVIGTRRVP
jgi:endoglucanase